MAKRKAVFITGGTGSVGQSLIELFTSSEFEVYFQFYKDVQKAQELSKKFKAQSFQIDFFGNFVLPDTNFDIIINNAGINISDARTHLVTKENWQKTLFFNLEIPFMIIKKYLPYMMENKYGRIINISSIYGLRASEENLPYTVSKHGLTGITQTIAKEYAEFGITCNEICPAAINSMMMDRIALNYAKKENSTVRQYLKEVCDAIPTKRMAEPKEIASLSLFLCSQNASFINGSSIPVDGGLIC
ncbi:MAG: SDR family oxidoreductase [Candidatus Kapabacteria bacterium]|nr:SDR family oxidoreductase [Candidatus Kapabacteria bacterium]